MSCAPVIQCYQLTMKRHIQAGHVKWIVSAMRSFYHIIPEKWFVLFWMCDFVALTRCCKLVSFLCFILYKIRYKLLNWCLRNIYFAFVYPNILYGFEVYGNTYVSYLDKLTTLNNKILRTLQEKGRCCNDCLYRQYDTLPPCQLFNYQVLRFVHTMVYLPI